MASQDFAVQDVIERLDSFYCHNVLVGLWADAAANRLEGMAIYLLSDELPEVADYTRAAARRLADRIGDLGGTRSTCRRHGPGQCSAHSVGQYHERHDRLYRRAVAGWTAGRRRIGRRVGSGRDPGRWVRPQMSARRSRQS